MPSFFALCVCLLGASGAQEIADPAVVAAVYTKRYNANPNDFENVYVLGLATFAEGAYGRSLALFERAARLTPTSATAAYAHASALRAAGDAPQALQVLREAVRKKGSTPGMWFDLGLALLQAGDPRAAADAFHQASLMRTAFAAAHYNAGVAFLNTGDLVSAKRDLQRTTQMVPDFGPAWNGLGMVAALDAKTDEAMASFRRADKFAALASYNLGVTAMGVGDFNRAAAAYTQAIHADPNLAQAHSNLGVVYDVLAQKEATLQSFLRVTTLLPDFVDGIYNLGLAYFRQGDLPEASMALHHVTHRQPNHADAWLHIGAIDLQVGQPHASQAALKRAAQEMAYGGALNPQTGERLLAEGRFAEGLQLYYQRVRRFPKSLRDYSALADAAVAQKQWQMALWALSEAARLKPWEHALRRRLVDTLVMANRLERARIEARLAVATWPESPDDWAALGEVERRLGDLDAAQDHFNRALALIQDHPAARVGLARTYLARGDTARVISLLEPHAHAPAPGFAPATELGLAYRQQGHMDKAARWFDRALADNPASATAWFNLGVTLFAAERANEARRALTQAVLRDANLAEAYYFLAVIAERAGRRSEAVSQVRIALRLDASHAEAQRLLARFNDFDH